MEGSLKTASFFNFEKEKRRITTRKWLQNDVAKIDSPQSQHTFSWVLNRVNDEECEVLAPASYKNYPLDINDSVNEWLSQIDKEDYHCAFFRNPQALCDVFYVRSLRPEKTGGKKEKVLLVEPYQGLKVLVSIAEEYGLEKVASLINNARCLALAN